MHISVWVWSLMNGCTQSPENDIGSPKAGVTGSCEPPWVPGTVLRSSAIVAGAL